MRAFWFLPVALLASGCQEYTVFTDTRRQDIQEYFTVQGVKSDILFYGDTSYSMQPELRKMSEQVGGFINRLAESQSDWQIITVTGPTGCSTSGILTPSTPNFADAFTTGLAKPPENTEADEWGLFNVFKAILNSAGGQCNDGFIRKDATLHVIFLSDEADTSPGWELGGDYWRDFVDPVYYYKEDTQLVKFSAIAGPVPGGCEGADPGEGYSDAVLGSGGEFISICSDWQSQVALLADASVAQSFFPMKYPPEDGTLSVGVNGTDRLEGWIYDPTRVGIEFVENLPGAYDEVAIGYEALVEIEVTEEGDPVNGSEPI